MQKAVIELKKYLYHFNEFDVAYLDGITPFQNGGEFPITVAEANGINVKDINEIKVENLSNKEQDLYMCENANYRLHPPRNQNKCIVIYFERLAGR